MSYGYDKYNLNERSIYKVFLDYDKKIIDFVLSLLEKEKMSYALVIKQYGPTFDGNNILPINLTYMERENLKGILTRMQSKIECVNFLMDKGKSLSDVKKMFSGKKDVEISHMISSILSQKKASKEENQVFTGLFSTKTQILTKYSIDEATLKSAVDEEEDETKRFCYTYSYGIGRNKMAVDEICALLNINKDKYQQNIKQVQIRLPELIKKALEKDEILGIKHEKVKVKTPRKRTPKERKRT